MKKDIRWRQRFQNYQRALQQLQEAVNLATERPLSNLEKQGMIQSFEFTHELSWKTLKDFLEHRGNVDIYGSRDATREAYKVNLIEDGDVWMEMIHSRNLTSHTYNELVASEIVEKVIVNYLSCFNQLVTKLQSFLEDE
ncbi:MAG: nucleotidyltransferase substrate binding protein [Bacillota bacterium]|nr:nucleotidyltransferase substrate binding protein [Bacillota bacterium]